MPDTPVPTSLDRVRAKSERIKLWAGIIAMILGQIAALTTAVLAHFKEEKGAKNVYQELSKAVEKVSEDQVQLYKDVSAMRGYLAGMAQQSNKPMVLWKDKVSRNEHKPVTAAVPKSGGGIDRDDISDDDSITVMPLPQGPPPAIQGPAPIDYNAPPVDSVVKK
jgi:hypothetical protein